MKKFVAVLIFLIIALVPISCSQEPEMDSFCVTFSGTDEKPYTVTIQQNQTVPEPVEPTMEGKQFLYWATENGHKYDFSLPITKDVVLRAVWKDDEKEQTITYYTVNFYDTYGEFILSQQVAEGEDAQAPAVKLDEFFVFDGWSKDISNIVENVDVYAIQRYDSVDESVFTYELGDDGTYTITGLKEGEHLPHIAGGYTKLALPTEYNGVAITAIASGAEKDGVFSHLNILSLYIPSCYKTIGDYAFYGNPALSRVTFNEGLTHIGKGAFMATFGDGYVFYGRYANSGASAYVSALTEIALPSSIEVIDDYAFNHVGGRFINSMYSLSPVTLTFGKDSALKRIGKYAFEGVQIYEISLPESTELKIEDYAFAADVYTNWVYVDSYDYPRSITTKLTLPESVTYIGDRAFYGLGVTSWYYGGSCTSSSANVQLVAPKLNLEYIGQEAFLNVSLVGELYLSTVQIADYAFSGHKLSKITIDARSIGKYSFERDGSYAPLTVEFTDVLAYIGEGAFYKNNGLSALSFPSLLVSIDKKAFEECKTLAGELNFGNMLRVVEERAFAFTSIDSVYVDGNVSIGQSCFEGSSVKSVIGTFREIGERAFYNCAKLQNVTLSVNMEKLPNELFYGCSSLKQINLPVSITKIGEGAFANCTKLLAITVMQNVKVIEKEAFYGCSKLSSVEFDGDKLEEVQQEAFALCPLLKEIVLPDSVTTIGDGVFRGAGLESFATPASLKKMGAMVFAQEEYVYSNVYGIAPISFDPVPKVMLPNLSEIVIRKETGIFEFSQHGTFGGSKITRFSVEDGNKYYSSIDGVLYSSDKTKLIAYIRDQSTTSINLPEGLVEIGSGAFKDNLHLISVSLPSSLVTIGDYAFYGCANIKGISLPSSLVTIGKYAFAGSEENKSSISLIEIGHNSRLSVIGEGAFIYNDALESIVLPSSLVSIGKKAFFGATKLSVLDLSKAKELTTIEVLAFGGDSSSANAIQSLDFSACSALVSTGKYAFAGSVSLTNIDFGNLTIIDEGSFYGCSALKNVVISSGITQIGNSAFRKCVGIEQITISSGSALKTIGAYAFAGSYFEHLNYVSLDLTNATMLSAVGDHAFAYGKVQYVKLPNSSYTLGEEAFLSQSLLVEIDFGKGIVSIGQNVFEGCVALTKIDIPASVTSIGKEAFVDLNLTTVNIGDENDGNSLKYIGKRAFYGCDNLEIVNIYGDNVPTLVGYADNLAFHSKDDDLNVNVIKDVKIYVDSGLLSSYVSENDFETGWQLYESCLLERA